jgi:hypothetical protein
VDAVHLAAAPASREVETQPVAVSTLDAEVPDWANRLYLKLDVQGYERTALDGAKRTLERVSAIQLELSFDHLYKGQSNWIELCAWLEDFGFVLRYIEPGYEDPKSGAMLQADFLFLRR